MIKTISVNENVTINHIPMSKLKTTTIGIYVTRELNRSEASKNAILRALED